MRKLTLIFLSFLLLCGCVKQQQPSQSMEEGIEYTPYTQFFESIYTAEETDVPLLNTMVKLVVYEEEMQKEAYDLVFPLLQEYHQYADIYYDYVDKEGNPIINLKTVNEAYGTNEKVLVSEELFAMLQEAIQFSKLTKGYFNPILGHVSEVYDGKFTSFPIENTDPEEAVLKNALACSISYEELEDVLEMNDEEHSIVFHKVSSCENANITPKINLGAFAKGYILDKASALLNTLNLSYMLDLGSSSIATHEVEESKDTWNIGIRSPFNKLTAMYAIELKGNYTVSTSGDDNRYYFKKNEDGTTTIRHHILNPFTGYSENFYRNITLISSKEGTAAVLDALSTALFSISDMDVVKQMIEEAEEQYDMKISYAFTIPKAEKYVTIVVDETMKDKILEEMRAEHIAEIIVK